MDLEAFLAAQEASGHLDSRGSFTLKVEKAREKLGKFALEHPGFYLLKVIQAAVAMGATNIHLATTQRGLGLWFDAPDGQPFADFQAAVANPAHPVSEPLRLLADGFSAALWTGLASACVIAWTGQGGQGLFLDGGGVVSGLAPPRPDDLLSLENVWMVSLSKTSQGSARSFRGCADSQLALGVVSRTTSSAYVAHPASRGEESGIVYSQVHTTLATFDAACKKLTLEQAAARFKFPFLLHEESQSEIEYQSSQTMGLAYMPTSTDVKEAAAWIVHQLKGPEPSWDVVSLGRAATNNVVVADASVSGTHARLNVQPGQAKLLVTDLGSRNGTFFGGVRQPPHTPVEVSSGAIITFGRVPLRYISVAEMLAYLKALRDQGKL